ncbi:hypothetical protein BRD56_10935 [Thermoplasmatales archaeon SW_10_69_26]|nr:MAG: hypothetical protein BRD56_10935 [Thermoplasmatales archaeon SW_10_69_26]
MGVGRKASGKYPTRARSAGISALAFYLYPSNRPHAAGASELSLHGFASPALSLSTGSACSSSASCRLAVAFARSVLAAACGTANASLASRSARSSGVRVAN